MLQTKDYEFWFVTGSQHLYGEETLELVDQHAKSICEGTSAGFLPDIKSLISPSSLHRKPLEGC